MGALGKKVYSGVGIVAALLFIVSGVLIFVSDGEITTDANSTALYLIAIAGLLAMVYSASMLFAKGTIFARKLYGVVLLISGIVFILSLFLDDAKTYVAIAALVAGIAALVDVLALFVSNIKGRVAYMCVSVFLAVVLLIMSAELLVGTYEVMYVLVVLLVLGIWLIVSAYVTGFVKVESDTKTREVVETPVAPQKKQEMAKNTKATPKAKKVEPRKEEPEKEEPKAEAKKAEAKVEPEKEEPEKEEPKAEAKKAEEPKKKEVAPDKATGDFMKKLMKSSDAANAQARKEAPKEEPKAEEVVEEAVEEPKAEEVVEEAVEETHVEEAPVEEPKAEEVVEESVISEPVAPSEDDGMFVAEEPNWGVVARDSVADEPAEEAPVEAPVEEPAAESGPVVAAVPIPAGDSEEEELGEDIYTDNSPEALVRRAAWNKGLRCRRGYGERNIPVAFVKGKVAVFVEDEEADTSVDDELRAEGWTVLRYNAADITDGKAQGDEIAAAVKANTRGSKKKK